MLYNIDFEVCALIILFIVIVILHSQYAIKDQRNLLFRLFVYATFFATLFDVGGSVMVSYYNEIPKWANILVNNLYALFVGFCGCLGVRYILEVLKIKNHKILIANYLIAAVFSIIIFINVFTGIVFTFKNGPYEHGILYYIIYIYPSLCLTYTAILNIVYRKRFPNKRYWLNLSFAIIPIIPTILQILVFKDILLTFFGIDIAILIMLFAIETPDYRQLSYLQSNLENEVARQVREIAASKKKIEDFTFDVVEAFVKTIDAKDDYTKNHSSRVAEYSVAIGKRLKLSDELINRLRISALLHDIGKVGVPDEILKKPGRLTNEEFEIIKSHTVRGGEILKQISEFDDCAYVARHHHERFDGKGYPDHLEGKDTRQFARIVCVADSFDAMTSKRVYKERAMTFEEARWELVKCSGTQFDPTIANIMIDLIDDGYFSENEEDK